MSAGERSCVSYGRCERIPSDWWDCNVYCPGYQSNGREPDSGPRSPESRRLLAGVISEHQKRELDRAVRLIVADIMNDLLDRAPRSLK